jgi:hypothetical protein
MSKDRRTDLLVKIVLSEARAGNLSPLIARISSRKLTDPEWKFLIDFLERHQSKRDKAELRELEQDLIRARVEGLITGEGEPEERIKPEAAIAQVMQERERGRSTIFNAMRNSKKRGSKGRESK